MKNYLPKNYAPIKTDGEFLFMGATILCIHILVTAGENIYVAAQCSESL